MNSIFRTAYIFDLLVVLIFLVSNTAAQEATTDRSPFDQLKSEYEEAMKVWQARYSGLSSSPSEELIERYNAWPGWTIMPKIVEVGTSKPDAPYSFDALKWFVVDFSRSVGVWDSQSYSHDERAMTALRTHHLANPRITELFRECSYYVTPSREKFLRECVEKGGTHEVRGLACFYLAECLQNKATFRSELAKAEEQANAFQKDMLARRSPDFLAYLRSVDEHKVLEEAKAVYKRVIDDFGDVEYPSDVSFALSKPNLAFMAKYSLAKFNFVAVGQPAPELAGTDLFGKERKLSDYKGKVVVLQLWASWCGPCIQKIPQLQELSKQHDEEAFCILGVNFDRDRDAASKFVKEKDLSWDSVWGLSVGESLGSWFGDDRPLTLLVIDHNGILRYESIEGEALSKAVESLLHERAGSLPGK